MSKGENMVERCARALDEAGYAYIDANQRVGRFGTGAMHVDWSDIPSEVFVRAVIEALMKPTPEMVTDGTFPYQERRHGGVMNSRLAVAEIYRSMLRTILSQPNEEGEGK